MRELTQKEKLSEFKNEIINSGYESYVNLNYNNKLLGTMYIKEKMDYGFHIYYIHEPSVSNPLAGINGTITEMYYDLRNKIYWIKRNMKEVQFSVRNIDTIFPHSKSETSSIFDKLSTKANKGLYIDALKYLGCMGEEKVEMIGRFFHRLITEHSYYELLHKAGVKVNSPTAIQNKNGKSPMEILGLSKTQWKMFSKYDLNPFDFRNLDDNEADKKLINYLAYIKTLEEEYGIEKCKVFFSNESSYLYKSYHHRSALNIAEQYQLPVKNFIKYIYFECDVSQGLSATSALAEYADYIRMTKEMGYERFDKYPKFLRTAHDIASRNYRIKLNESELEEWKESIQKSKEFTYACGEYKIFPPELPEDLVREGNVLGHCVGSYVNKVRKGLSTILFLREKRDLECPLVTVEVKDSRIIQARGKMNNAPSKEQKDAVKKFAQKFNLAM